MAEPALNVLAVIGSLNRKSITRVVVHEIERRLAKAGCVVDVVDLLHEPLELFNPDLSFSRESYINLKKRVNKAGAFVLGTPDYHGSISGAMKNFLDHFWHEFTGKLIAPAVASHEKGLTVIDQLRTIARQCYAWTLPYGLSFMERQDVHEGKIVSETLDRRLDMFCRDLRVYGSALAAQRNLDLSGSEPGMMAKLRGKQ